MYRGGSHHNERNRGNNYNHSTFVDLVLQLLGLRPGAGRTLVVNPLLPEASGVAFFAVDGLRIKDRDVTIAFDRSGARYGLGAGLHVLVDGKLVASAKGLEKLVVQL